MIRNRALFMLIRKVFGYWWGYHILPDHQILFIKVYRFLKLCGQFLAIQCYMHVSAKNNVREIQHFKDSEQYKYYFPFEIANKVVNLWFQLNVKAKISGFGLIIFAIWQWRSIFICFLFLFFSIVILYSRLTFFDAPNIDLFRQHFFHFPFVSNRRTPQYM
jgi:hypothetical protein